jgi:hypothetical protein
LNSAAAGAASRTVSATSASPTSVPIASSAPTPSAAPIVVLPRRIAMIVASTSAIAAPISA